MGVYYGFMQPSYLWHFQEKSQRLSEAFSAVLLLILVSSPPVR